MTASLATEASLDDLAFVEQAFARHFGRPVDPATLRNLLERLAAGLPRAAALDELRNSDEAVAHAARWTPGRIATVEALLRVDDTGAFVDNAWRLLAGSEVDPAGRAAALQRLQDAPAARLAWLREVRAATADRAPASPLTDVHVLDLEADELRRPALSLERMLALPHEAFLFAAYRQLLGRPPDGGGRAAYLSRLRAGASRLAVLQSLAGSEEGRRHGGSIAGWDRAAHPWQRAMATLRRTAQGLRQATRRARRVTGRLRRRPVPSRIPIEQKPR